MNKHKYEVTRWTAEWCQPCKRFAPVFDKVAAEMSGKAKFSVRDVDANQADTEAHQVMSVPTVTVSLGGKPIAALPGAVTADRLEKFIEKAIGA